jgi:hypothetical protein
MQNYISRHSFHKEDSSPAGAPAAPWSVIGSHSEFSAAVNAAGIMNRNGGMDNFPFRHCPATQNHQKYW